MFKVGPRDPNFGSLFDLFSTTFREPWVIQKFLPQVAEGDKRIVLVDGEALGAVNRVPVGDDIRSNMVRGGAAEATELTPREREICARIGPELKRRGLVFVGIDVIDGYLTEINVTSPTGIRAIKRLGGPDLAAAIWDAIEARTRAARGGRRANEAILACSPPPSRERRRGRIAAPARALRPRRGSTRSSTRLQRQARRATKRRFVAPRSTLFAAALEAGAPRRAARSKTAAAAAPAPRALSDLEDELIRAIHDMARASLRPDDAAAAEAR